MVNIKIIYEKQNFREMQTKFFITKCSVGLLYRYTKDAHGTGYHILKTKAILLSFTPTQCPQNRRAQVSGYFLSRLNLFFY